MARNEHRGRSAFLRWMIGGGVLVQLDIWVYLLKSVARENKSKNKRYLSTLIWKLKHILTIYSLKKHRRFTHFGMRKNVTTSILHLTPWMLFSPRRCLDYWVRIDRLLAGRLSCHSALRVCIIWYMCIYFVDFIYRDPCQSCHYTVTLANVTFYSVFWCRNEMFWDQKSSFTFYRHWLQHIQVIPRIIGPHGLFWGQLWRYIGPMSIRYIKGFNCFSSFHVDHRSAWDGWIVGMFGCLGFGMLNGWNMDGIVQTVNMTTLEVCVEHTPNIVQAIVSTHPYFCMWWFIYTHLRLHNYVGLYLQMSSMLCRHERDRWRISSRFLLDT